MSKFIILRFQNDISYKFTWFISNNLNKVNEFKIDSFALIIFNDTVYNIFTSDRILIKYKIAYSGFVKNLCFMPHFSEKYKYMYSKRDNEYSLNIVDNNLKFQNYILDKIK